eukprot:CAMPEP_0169140146 /NCGR_PEP_ID=MMETSP1015-20121227/43428_1 /TAXON_ID=342587 /ORGANISM="Karlodinium micrum, Strain CCMP2283" /LENGTH=56 /DNA_ID=CAMNT_0009206061 /DNA_START=681 /DNA_END=851 /DNA_ORIENTATION=+
MSGEAFEGGAGSLRIGGDTGTAPSGAAWPRLFTTEALLPLEEDAEPGVLLVAATAA